MEDAVGNEKTANDIVNTYQNEKLLKWKVQWWQKSWGATTKTLDWWHQWKNTEWMRCGTREIYERQGNIN